MRPVTDQSNRRADQSLREADPIACGSHGLVAYKMKPKPGYGFPEAAAHFAAESSTGTTIKPKLGPRPEPFAAAAYQFWLGGDFIKNDQPQGDQTFASMKKTVLLVVDAMRRTMDKTGEAKI